MRNVRLELTGAELGRRGEALPSQVIPTARRACYSAFLLATPRMMEPVDLLEITYTPVCSKVIARLLSLRRGFVISDRACVGTPLSVMLAYVPTLETFGLETDLRVQSAGLAFCSSRFDHWEILEGDPLDDRIQLRPLEPADILELPREIMIKTRRRKGLSETVAISKYFDLPA
jgi:U5 small nuclear ribonucleoprotein component